jgi:SPP1 gp7 family putative phage head morphogenesis protein
MEKEKLDKLALLLTQHADDLEKYSYYLSENHLEEFESTASAISEIIFEIYSLYGEDRINENPDMNKLIKQIRQKIRDIREGYYEDLFDEFSQEMEETDRNEKKFISAYFAFLAGGGVLHNITQKEIENIRKNGIYSGNTIYGQFQDILDSEVKKVSNSIIESISSGKNIMQAREEVQKILQRIKQNVASNIELGVMGVAADTAMAFSAENNAYLLYSTALDSLVCPVCRKDEGRIFAYNDENIPQIPRHYNCRCTYIVLPSKDPEYRNLVMPFSEYAKTLPEREKKERFDNMELQRGQYIYPKSGFDIKTLAERDKKAIEEIMG